MTPFLEHGADTKQVLQHEISSNAVIMGDSTQIHQVVMNLCTNSSHAMREKGGKLEIKLDDVDIGSDVVSNYKGLGLFVVHGLIGNHKDSITFESKVGKGTLFKILIPTIKENLAPGSQKKTTIPTGNESILFVDDETYLVSIGKEILESLGYHVVTFTNSISALEPFNSNPDRFDLVITDMTMPNMTGEKLATELMSIRPNLPIILCTGCSS